MNLGISFFTSDNIIKRFGESEEIFVHDWKPMVVSFGPPATIALKADGILWWHHWHHPCLVPLASSQISSSAVSLFLLCGWFWHWKEALNRTGGWIEGEADGCLCHSPFSTTTVIKWQTLDVDGSRSEVMTSQPPNRRRGTRWRLMCPLAFPAPEKEPTWPRERENEENERERGQERTVLTLP